MRVWWRPLSGRGLRFVVLPIVGLLASGCGDPPGSPSAATAPTPAAVDSTDPAALEARRVALRAQLKELVGDLTVAGKYDCCVEAPCNLCAMRAGGCKCGEGLRNGEPVCEECAMMWKRGNGAEAGVDPSSVRSFLEAEREMEAKAKREGGRSTADGEPTAEPTGEPTVSPSAAPSPAACACPGHAEK